MVLGLASCTNDDTPVVPQEYDGVPLVIFDTDIGSSTDDLFSLEMLYYYQEQGKCKLLGVVVDREGEDCAACADVMNTYFNNGNLPIGLIRNGIKDPKVWINYKALPTYTKGDDTPMFARSIDDYSALPDGWQLYRRLLAAQPDHSVSICSVGFTACLGQMMWDPLTVINAVEGDDLFMLSDRGTVALNDDGTVIFTFSATGNSRVQIPGDDAWRAAMQEKIRNVNKTQYLGRSKI